ncbi:MAG: hypothetical protein K2X53_06645 [Alphaproteobacteria bacterium]|nr:hypothetical protein [Alphaproteobacteria bacterium]
MTKLSTFALAVLISASALSTAEASKNSYESKFVEESNSITARSLRSGKMRATFTKAPQVNVVEDEKFSGTLGGSSTLAEEGEDAQPTGILSSIINYFSSFFTRA